MAFIYEKYDYVCRLPKSRTGKIEKVDINIDEILRKKIDGIKKEVNNVLPTPSPPVAKKSSPPPKVEKKDPVASRFESIIAELGLNK